MRTVKIEVRKAMLVVSAVKLIETNDALEIETAYWLGRLSDTCSSIVKNAYKLQTKSKKEITDPEELEVKLQQLMDIPEEVSVYEFNISHFQAKEDIKSGDKVIKKGAALVPIKFFTLMGDLITNN